MTQSHPGPVRSQRKIQTGPSNGRRSVQPGRVLCELLVPTLPFVKSEWGLGNLEPAGHLTVRRTIEDADCGAQAGIAARPPWLSRARTRSALFGVSPAKRMTNET